MLNNVKLPFRRQPIKHTKSYVYSLGFAKTTWWHRMFFSIASLIHDSCKLSTLNECKTLVHPVLWKKWDVYSTGVIRGSNYVNFWRTSLAAVFQIRKRHAVQFISTHWTHGEKFAVLSVLRAGACNCLPLIGCRWIRSENTTYCVTNENITTSGKWKQTVFIACCI